MCRCVFLFVWLNISLCIWQVVHAISYCHQLHVVHRDLKPENVVFFEKLGMVKLTDFGFSNKYDPGQKLETSCGSLAYSAPEILLGDSYDAPAVDIWSLGVILYMLVCGHPPFQVYHQIQIVKEEKNQLLMIWKSKFFLFSFTTHKSCNFFSCCYFFPLKFEYVNHSTTGVVISLL